MRKAAALLALKRKRGKLRVLSAWELLQARAEARTLAPEEDGELTFLACLLTRAMGRKDPMTLLRRCSAQEVLMLAEEYYALCRELSPALGDEQALRALEAELADAPYLRLYWRVLRAFRALPNEQRAQTLTDGELLFCAANLALDERENRDEPRPEFEAEENPAFDEARFLSMKEGEA